MAAVCEHVLTVLSARHRGAAGPVPRRALPFCSVRPISLGRQHRACPDCRCFTGAMPMEDMDLVLLRNLLQRQPGSRRQTFVAFFAVGEPDAPQS